MPHFHEDEPTISYGIREVQTQRYWDMAPIRGDVRFYEGEISADHKMAIRSWERYHLACIKRPGLPKVEMVRFEAQPEETGVLNPEIPADILMREKIRFHLGEQAEKAARALMEARPDWEEFGWIIFRSGGYQKVKDLVPEAFSFGRISFCRTATEAVQIKLILGQTVRHSVEIKTL